MNRKEAAIIGVTFGLTVGILNARNQGWSDSVQSPVQKTDHPVEVDNPTSVVIPDYKNLPPDERIIAARGIISEAYDLNRNYPNDRLNMLLESQNIVMDEAEFFKQISNNPEITLKGKSLSIGSRRFNLTTTSGLTYADLTFEALFADQFNVRGVWIRTPDQALNKLDSIQHRLKVQDSNVPSFVDVNSVVTLDNILQTLKRKGKVIPGQIRATDARVEAIIQNHQAGTLEYQLAGNKGSFIRGLGIFYLREDPKLFADYQAALKEQVSDPEQKFITDFTKYFDNGSAYRRYVTYKQMTDPVIGEQSAASYKVFRDWAGSEFSINGYTQDMSDYALDDLAIIKDPEELFNQANKGVILKQKPTLEVSPQWPYVVTGSMVRVANPNVKDYMNFNASEVTSMIQVQTGSIVELDDKKVWIPTIPPQIGWIQKEYLDGIYQHSPNYDTLVYQLTIQKFPQE